MAVTDLSHAIYLEGQGSVGIVLFHAYTGTTADVNLLARELNREGYTVLCPLFKGHGTGDIFDLLQGTPEDWWQQAQDCVRWLKKRYELVFVFGLSMGGIFATRALLEADLGIVAGGCFNSPIVTKRPIHLEKPFMAYAKSLALRKKALAQFEQDEQRIRAAHFEQVERIMAFTVGYRPALVTLTQPYYIAQSAQDELIDPDDAYELQNELEQAMRIDFNWFSENTHAITANSNRKEFELSVKRFIEKVLETL
ncbi:alpha/beta fold hydrolase [Aerococcaceae bacterium NML190073]|nr:alpha/beta fold hydrolase [Aerococcaceae bacterium NML190073]